MSKQQKILNKAFFSACMEEDIELVKYYIEKGANINETIEFTTRFDKRISSPLIEACIRGNEDLVKLLVEHGADVNIGYGAPLVGACHYEYFSIVKFLIDNGANIKSISNELLVESFHHSQIFKYLIKKGLSIKEVASELIEMFWDSEDIKHMIYVIDLIVKEGISIRIDDDNILDYSLEYEIIDIIEFILPYYYDLISKGHELEFDKYTLSRFVEYMTSMNPEVIAFLTKIDNKEYQKYKYVINEIFMMNDKQNMIL